MKKASGFFAILTAAALTAASLSGCGGGAGGAKAPAQAQDGSKDEGGSGRVKYLYLGRVCTPGRDQPF